MGVLLMGPDGADLLGGGPPLRTGGPLFIGGGPLDDIPLKKGSLDGGLLIPLGPPLEPRGPLGGPRLRECISGGPRLPALSN